jgi:dimethylhistidine N-methyltransferase
MARERIASWLPEVCVEPVVANYVTNPPQLESFNGTTLAIYIGSSIGNFSPKEARTILHNLGSQLQAGDALLLGTDLVKDESTLVAAYDDKGGVTAEFNLNILHRLNRELGADFDLASFRHRALWNCVASRIEMHLESTQDQRVRIATAGLNLRFATRETIHTENSYKFTHETIRVLIEDAGFEVEQTWTDERRWYAVTLARIQ